MWVADELFNSHPHKEDDFVEWYQKQLHISFQLTSSQGGWLMFFQVHRQIPFFNSHPHKEDDYVLLECDNHTRFSTHILTRRMTIWSSSSDISRIFQLTSSQGGWLLHGYLPCTERFFNSHPHKEDDKYEHPKGAIIWVFQLTSSQGGWPGVRKEQVVTKFFNSHPHKEDD